LAAPEQLLSDELVLEQPSFLRQPQAASQRRPRPATSGSHCAPQIKEQHVSHIVQIRSQVKDPVAVAAACQRLGLAIPKQETVELFSDHATGFAVRLPGWKYPVVFDLAAGEARYDNYGGQWGDQQCLDRFMQAYAVEKARIEARKRGHCVTEQQLADGSIKLTIQVAGGVA
jgi:hypothetical protein